MPRKTIEDYREELKDLKSQVAAIVAPEEEEEIEDDADLEEDGDEDEEEEGQG